MSTFTPSRMFLPYCLDRVTGDTFVVLNRFYQPISMPMSSGGIHEDGFIHFQLEGLTPELAAKLSVHGDKELNRIYFYGDGSAPWLGKGANMAFERRIAFLRELIEDQDQRLHVVQPSVVQ